MTTITAPPLKAPRPKLRVSALDGAAEHPLVTARPTRAGLERHSAAELRAGAVRGIVCGGPGDAGVLTVPAGVHGLVVGRTGAGKTRLVIEPTILANAQAARDGAASPASQPHIISLDCKGTVLRETADRLAAQGYRIHVFDLAATASPDCWNPLSEMHRALAAGNETDADLVLSRLEGPLTAGVADESDRYWDQAAWDAIAGVARGISLAWNREPTFAEVNTYLVNTTRLKALAEFLGDRAPVGLVAATQLSEVPRTWSCVRSTAATMLRYVAGGSGKAISACSTVDFVHDLFDDSRPSAYYIVIPDTSQAANAYAALLVDTLYRTYCAEHDRRHLEGSPDARRVLFVLDEFARLPRLEISSALSAGRSRGITVLLALQSIAQLTERGTYSPEEARTMLEQAAATIYLSATSPEAGRDAALKSGGIVTERELMLLPQGQAYVSLAGHPMVKTRIEPVTAWYEALGCDDDVTSHAATGNAAASSEAAPSEAAAPTTSSVPSHKE